MGRQRLRMRDVVRRDTEVTEVVEGTANVKNERRGEERHGGDRGCGRRLNGQDIMAEEWPLPIDGRKKMLRYSEHRLYGTV